MCRYTAQWSLSIFPRVFGANHVATCAGGAHIQQNFLHLTQTNNATSQFGKRSELRAMRVQWNVWIIINRNERSWNFQFPFKSEHRPSFYVSHMSTNLITVKCHKTFSKRWSWNVPSLLFICLTLRWLTTLIISWRRSTAIFDHEMCHKHRDFSMYVLSSALSEV